MITEFTPLAALIGGSLIGLSAVLLMLTLGRIMGATGILAGVLFPSSGLDLTWRLALLAGMVSGPLAFFLLTGAPATLDVPTSRPVLMLGGLIVGVGVTYSAGCTSGHGVCGMARLSPRSIAATLTFMLTTGLTVYVTRHVLGA